VPDPGEGQTPGLNGSDDDDDCYVRGVATPWTDPDPVLEDDSRSLVFYQVTLAGNSARLVKNAASVTLGW